MIVALTFADLPSELTKMNVIHLAVIFLLLSYLRVSLLFCQSLVIVVHLIITVDGVETWSRSRLSSLTWCCNVYFLEHCMVTRDWNAHTHVCTRRNATPVCRSHSLSEIEVNAAMRDLNCHEIWQFGGPRTRQDDAHAQSVARLLINVS